MCAKGVHTLPMLYVTGIRGPDCARLRALLNGPVDDDAEVREALTLQWASPGMPGQDVWRSTRLRHVA